MMGGNMEGKSSMLTWIIRFIYKARQNNALMYLLYYSCVVAIATSLYVGGFLLMRYEFNDISQCNTLPFGKGVSQSLFYPNTNLNSYGSGCWMPPTFKKAVIIMIDSLRYDFLEEQVTTGNPHYNKYIHNQMPNMNRLYRERPSHTLQYKFVADAPTVTMQRIKGIATGSLPTFIDIGSNFGGSKVYEDNMITQLSGYNNSIIIDDEKQQQHNNNNNNNYNNNEKKNQDIKYRKKLIFAGDDTWMSLFDEQFYKKYPFPSFSVRDFHTVDEGVISKILPVVQNKDGPWDVAIGHMLGVDHIGHIIGNQVPEFAKKLNQVDNFLFNIIEHLDDDTLFMVIGDHGQKHDGSHSGADPMETDSGLFVYSKSKPINNTIPIDQFNLVKNIGHRVVNQIDFGVSLSLLLGAPIPYGSIGQVIPELFLSTEDTELDGWKKLIDAERLTLWQLRQFIYTYSELSNDFKESKLFKDFDKQMDLLETEYSSLASPIAKIDDFQHVYQQYSSLSHQVYRYCVEKWATFDRYTMVWSVVALGFLLISMLVVITNTIIHVHQSTSVGQHQPMVFPLERVVKFAIGGVLMSPLVWLLSMSWNHFTVVMICMGCIGSSIGIMYDLLKSRLSFLLRVAIQSVGKFSILTTYYIIAPLMAIIIYVIVMTSYWYVEHQDEIFSYFTTIIGLHIIYLYYLSKKRSRWQAINTLECIVLMLSYIFTSSYQSYSLSERIDYHVHDRSPFNEYINLIFIGFSRYGWPLVIMYFISNQFIFHQFQQIDHHDNNNINIQNDQHIDKTMLKVALISIGVFWYIQSTLQMAGWSYLTRCIFPWIVYSISLAGLFRVFKYSYNHNYTNSFEGRKRMLVYKLSLFLMYLMITVILLLRPHVATDVMWMCIEFVLVISIYRGMIRQTSHFKESKDQHLLPAQSLSSPVVVEFVQWTTLMLVLICSTFYHFFSSGHRYAFGLVQFESGYIGFEDFFMPRTGLMVALNTFSSPIFFSFALPLAIIYLRYITSQQQPHINNSNNITNINSNILQALESRWRSMNDIMIGYLLFVFYFILINFAISIILIFKLQDLYLWTVYAPLYIFNTVQMVVIIVSSVFSYGIFSFIKSKLGNK